MPESTTVEANVTPLASDSRTIDDSSAPTNALGRGVHLPEGEQKPEEHKPISTREAIAKAFDENTKTVEEKANAAAEAAKAKVDATDKTEVKPEKVRADDGKFAKADTNVDAKADKSAPEQAAAERGAPEERQSEGRKYSEPPARFLPEAREKWANVPANIKAEFHRVSQELESETAKYRQSHEAYEAVRQFDEQAKASGTDLKTALTAYTNIENMLRSDPVRGVAEVLKNIGLTPQQYAQHVMQNPQAHQFSQQVQQQPAQTQQRNPEIESLRSEINSMKQQAIIPEIERFYEANSITPGSDIENALASVLESGVIEKIYGNGLSLTQRLSEALRMAGGQPPSRSEPEVSAAPVPAAPQARPVDPDGQKSIKGAPTSGQTGEPAKRFKSNREALEAAFSAYAR